MITLTWSKSNTMYGDQQRTKTEEKNNFLLSSALIDLGKTGAGEPDGVYLPKMITKVIYNRRAGQSRWSNPGGQNSELLYNVIAPMMADAELPSRVMQPQASSTSSGNLRRSFS